MATTWNTSDTGYRWCSVAGGYDVLEIDVILGALIAEGEGLALDDIQRALDADEDATLFHLSCCPLGSDRPSGSVPHVIDSIRALASARSKQ